MPDHAPAQDVEVGPVQAEKPARADDCKAIGDKINELAELRGAEYKTVYDAVFASKALRAAGFNDNGDLTDSQAKAALKLLDVWISATQAAQQQAEQPADMPEYETD